MGSFHRAYALHHARLPVSLMYAILLLQRLEVLFPAAEYFSGPGPYSALVIPVESSSPALCGQVARRHDVDMSTSSLPTPGVSSSVSVLPASIAAPRMPTDIVLGCCVEAVGGKPEMCFPSKTFEARARALCALDAGSIPRC